MAIDFNKQLVFDPKIEIVGKEVPLAALEKTGNILQDRYDKSYENYSMTDEALKQMEASANAVDREKAKELRGMYNQEMQGILQKGDFHNMRQQTAALARNAAINYKTIAEKNVKIQAELDAIAKNPKYILDPEGAAQDYLKNLKPISINPETKTISDFNVGTYNAPADVDEMKWAITYGAVMKPTIDKVKGTSIVSVDKFGKETNDPNQAAMLMVKTSSGSLVELKTEDLQKALLPAAYADPNIQARLNRDTKRAGYDPNTEEGKVYKEGLFNNQTLPAISAAAGLLRRQEDMSAEGVALKDIPRATGDGDGSGKDKTPKPLPAILQSDPVPGEGNEVLSNFAKKPFDQVFYKLPLLQSKGPFGGLNGNYGEILPAAKSELFFISKSLKEQADRLKTSKDPNDKKLYDTIVASGALSIFNSMSKDQSPSKEFVDNLMKKINNGELNNVAMPSAYKFVTGDDANFRANELDRQFPDKKGDPVAQMKQLNFITLGSEDGLDITKKGDVAMTLQGWDLFNPLTGEYNTASAAIQGKGDGLKIGTPTRDQTMMRVIGKAIPGTVLNATSKTPYGDLSHFGEAYVVSVNGENLLLANRNNKGNLNSRLNDLSAFSRTMREDTDYKALNLEGKTVDVKIKSDGNNITVTTNNTPVSIPKELYLTALEQARQMGIDPVFYLTTIKP